MTQKNHQHNPSSHSTGDPLAQALRFDPQIIQTLDNCEGCPLTRGGAVHVPVVHTSTIVMPNLATLENPQENGYDYDYARGRNPTSDVLANVLNATQESIDTWLCSCGQSATHMSLTGLSRPGAHIVACDNIYGTTRKLLNYLEKTWQVRTTFVDITDLEQVERAITSKTTVLLCESVGSNTFEVSDIPRLAEISQAHDIMLTVDNTWGAAGLICRPLQLGADLVIESLTKYPSGNANLLAGSVSLHPRHGKTDRHAQLFQAHAMAGHRLNADDSFRLICSLHTMVARIERHWNNTISIIRFLEHHPLIDNVFCPALPNCPGHEIWHRDFDGANGLFSFQIRGPSKPEGVAAFLSQLQVCQIGYSWGSFETLITPPRLSQRTAMPHTGGDLFRLHVGLGSVETLKADLDSALHRYTTA